jgi:hypothetical protein
VASIEQFNALGIDVLGLQVPPDEGDRHAEGRRD